MKSKFEQWFQQQPFYLNLRFIHGERLFIFDAQDGYVVQAVQISWATWQEQQKRIDELQLKVSEDSRILHNIINIERNKCDGLQAQIELLKDQFADMKEYFDMQEYLYQGDSYNRGWNSALVLIKERLAKALKGGEPKEQEPQACDHTMVEKTQFGDLQRTFECIFCDHKTTEAWVTTHE